MHYRVVQTRGKNKAIDQLVALAKDSGLETLRLQAEADEKAAARSREALEQAQKKQSALLYEKIIEFSPDDLQSALGTSFLLVQSEDEFPIRQILHTGDMVLIRHFTDLVKTRLPCEGVALKAHIAEPVRYIRKGRWQTEDGTFWREVSDG